ncbi:hypothetical protein [Sulfuricurvum sp.]|jgi:hypothetical protein|nr:hypothetical protein [Sulfuricurvum sp.]
MFVVNMAILFDLLFHFIDASFKPGRNSHAGGCTKAEGGNQN